MDSVDILLPTCNRTESLILTLGGIAGQNFPCFRVIVADQSDQSSRESPVVESVIRMIQAHCGTVDWHQRAQVHGIAEQRDFLLNQATADYVLYLDDDVWMKPQVVSQLVQTIKAQKCGFVGAFPAGLSYADDFRPEQQAIDYWDGPVQPEALEPNSPQWERYNLHRAANVYHAAQSIPENEKRIYKVAWVAQCVLYDRRKLLEVGGFSFWDRLPRFHSGEEVLVQNLMMRKWGGCAILPSNTFSSEVATTVLNPKGSVDGHALDLLDEMVDRYAPESRHVAAHSPA